MKVKDLLKLLIDGQYVEFNYIDEEGYITGYDVPMYRHNESEGYSPTIYTFLDRAIVEIYSNVEINGYEVELDYLAVVLKREEF